MEKGTKVRQLTNGIKTDVLNAIKANILASPVIQRDFDGCATLFKSFITSNRKSKDSTLNISKLNTDSDPDARGSGGGRGQGRGAGRGFGRGGSGGRGNGGRDGKSRQVKRKRDGKDSESSDVLFSYHTYKEYGLLSEPNKAQLKEWRMGE